MNGSLVLGMLISVMIIACNAGEDAPIDTAVQLPDTVTFAEHIAPIVWENCMPCHRAGQIGPFSLITYNDVRRKARTVRKMTTNRWMPPWPADTSYTQFLGQRTLNERQIRLISKWVETGAMPGDTATMPNSPRYPDTPPLGEPDHVVWVPDTMHIPGDAKDYFMITKAPFELKQDTFARAIVFEPGDRKSIHHMNGGLINYATGARKDVFAGHGYINAEESGGVEAFTKLQLGNDDGTWPALAPSAVNYLPGMTSPMYPEGIGGYFLKQKGAFLLNTIHYGPTAEPRSDRSRFLIYYAKKAPERPLQELALGTLGETPVEPPLHLVPGEVNTFRSKYVLPESISVLSVNPHMHLLGTKFLAYAITLKSDTIPLIRINDWDFRWQYVYTYPKMLVLPKGATIHVFGTFDNTAENPQQPYDPPREVFGTDSRFMKTTDEMFQFFISYVEWQEGDESINLQPPPFSSSSAATIR